MYDNFAEIYDRLQDIDYESIADYYEKIFKALGLKPSLVLDLACGTGNITIPMSRRGYDMIGVDLSAEMLGIATDKARAENRDILFLNQDMTEFELYGTVDAIVCALDGVNYLTEAGDLDKLFSLVQNYLNPDGVFIFDINSEYKLKNILADNTYIYDEDDIYCVWSSELDENEGICGFSLDYFVKDENGTYRRYEEYQEEKIYTEADIVNAAQKYALKVCGIYDDRSTNPPNDKTERIFFVLQKQK